jgi:hypothetical protein
MYRQDDIDIIKKNMDIIKDDAMKKKLDILEPTLNEFKEVLSVILDFIKRKKRIIYGGYAQNNLIKIKNEFDVFYKKIDLPDIEFYTYQPLEDTIELCDLLHSKKFKYVQGVEAEHEGTYKIFVNFINYCDLTFVSKNIYDNMSCIKDNDLLYTHPHFMVVDAFRVYADPLTSYFRLDKTFSRFTTLMKYYPFDLSLVKNIPFYEKENKETKRFIRHKILHDSQLIIIGHYAFNYLVKKFDKKMVVGECPYYQVISINYAEDKVKLGNFLKSHLKNITSKEFYPYFQFYDKHTEYYQEGVCILKIYGHNNRCIVNQYSEKKKVYFGTFQLIFLYLLIDYQYAITRRDSVEKNNYMILITRLLITRDKYLDKHNKTILDRSPFQEFTLQCLGTTEDPLRMSRLESRKKRDAKKQIKFRYDPKGTPGKVPNFAFNNSSGNEIIKKNNR